MSSTLAVVDYGMGNLRSVAKALEFVAPAGMRVLLTDDPLQILAADRVVFPGQGAARDCMNELVTRDLVGVIRQVAGDRPFLGICMGMQVLMDYSQENGGTDCLGLVAGEARFFGDPLVDPANGERLKIPHMGWNEVQQTREHPLWAGIAQDSRFYFVHSYFVDPADPAVVVGSTGYGRRFASALARDNIFAMQCHPEKSAAAGLALLGNFARWDGRP